MRKRAALRGLTATFAAGLLALTVLGVAGAAITPTTNDAAGAQQIAAAIAVDPTIVTGASYLAVPAGTPNGVEDSPLSFFPTDGSTFGILTTGNVLFADQPNTSGNTGQNLGGGNVRGNTDYDVSVMKVDLAVPQGANCLTFNFGFYSDEYPEWVNTRYNDAFIAELDTSTWTTSGSTISAPDNFAFDPVHNVISINAAGNTSMNAANAAGTTYDGATPLLSASHQVAPGAHSLYLSIFDQGDQVYDSAVFLDNLVVGFVPNPAVNCVPGAKPVLYKLTLSPAEKQNPVGATHTVTATLTTSDGTPVPDANIGVTVSGANAQTMTVGPTDAAGKATISYVGTTVGSDQIAACYDQDGDGTCEAVASAAKEWVHDYQLVLSPLTAVNHAGTSHTVTATLTDGPYSVDSAPILYSVAGTGSHSGSATTDSAGTATFTYSSDVVGTDTITACYDLNANDSCDTDEPTAVAEKTWTNDSPTCDSLTGTGDELWPPNHTLHTWAFTGGVDPEGDPLTTSIAGVWQDEPVNGLGDGDMSPDAVIGPASNEVQLRAERSGTGDGRFYHVTVLVTDPYGGTCTKAFAIATVPHDQGKHAPVDGGSLFDSTLP